jgi:DNA mismatch repair protein MutS
MVHYNGSPTLTPMMRQYFELKGAAQDAILFFRMGDFYEVFGDDAILVSPLLEIVLTSRERGDQTKIPFCGVPHHAAKNYWLKLIRLGLKVAIADQVEDPKTAKGIVRREITKYITPACTDELEALDRDAPNYLAAAVEDPHSKQWTFLVSDVSTGELRIGVVETLQRVDALIETFHPREMLVRRFHLERFRTTYAQAISERKISFDCLSEASLRDEESQKTFLKNIFAVSTIRDFPCGIIPSGEGLVVATLQHLQKLKLPIEHFASVQPLFAPESMQLDEVACRDLEIFETIRRRQSEGSLFREINACLTPMGSRRLRGYISQPLTSIEKIKQRQEAVVQLTTNDSLLDLIRQHLGQVSDLDRLITRVMSRTISPPELYQVRIALDHAEHIGVILPDFMNTDLLQSVKSTLSQPTKARRLIEAALVDTPVGLGTGFGVFRDTYRDELRSLTNLARNSEQAINEYEQKLRDQTKINSLKVRMHKNFGLLIEVTKSHVNKVPPDFIRRQTMVNNERYVTQELSALSEAILAAQENLIAEESRLYAELLDQLTLERSSLQLVAYAVSVLDVFQSYAWKAKQSSYVRPETTRADVVDLRGSRHPVIERFVGAGNFTVNDLLMSNQHKQLLITGPNMGGKSTIMRQLALSALMHQIGMFVPASSATLPVFDAIFTRVGASDDLAKGQSTFLVEMVETAQILRSSTKRSLVILDEVGRGTSTQDGLAIAAAVLEELATRIECYCLFATHFHELVERSAAIPTIRSMQMEVENPQSAIRFTHRLIEGATKNSYGIEVASLAGIPKRVIDRAQSLLDQPSSHVQAPTTTTPLSPPVDPLARVSGAISARLDRLNIHRTTPLQALNILNELKSLSNEHPQSPLFD